MKASRKSLKSGGLILLLAVMGMILPSTSTASSCVNETLRIGPSVDLPDCRAYELVSPANSNGRLLTSIDTFGYGTPFDLFPMDLGSADGESFVYEAHAGALESPAGASGVFDVYKATRRESGWKTTDRLTPTPTSLEWTLPGGVSADQGYSFFSIDGAESYLRKPDGSLQVTGIGSLGSEPQAQGRYITAGGKHVIFTTGKNVGQSQWCKSKCQALKLEPNAPPTGTGVVYDREADGDTHVVSLLPGNKPPAASEDAFFVGASTDGTAIAFTVAGSMYVRLDNAKTVELPPGVTRFAGFSINGHFMFYMAGEVIHRFDTTTGSDLTVAEGSIVNISDDGSHVYLISPQQLDGIEAKLGAPNLYSWQSGGVKYITTVLPTDLESTSGPSTEYPGLTHWVDWVANHPAVLSNPQGPGADSSRVTPDGSVLVFESRAQVTTYDNGGHTEIYRYDDQNGNLECVSCPPGGELPTADARLQDLTRVNSAIILNNVSDDGSRVFFETANALVKRDTNGINDIYEWHDGQEPPVHLISSGTSPLFAIPLAGLGKQFFPLPNTLLSVSPNGSDVFFAAEDALTPGAGQDGTEAIYDARIGGGFPFAPAPAQCAEEDCRAAAAAGVQAAFNVPSEIVRGAGNEKKRRGRCRHTRRSLKKKAKRRCSRSGRGGVRDYRPSARASVEAREDPAEPEPHYTIEGGAADTVLNESPRVATSGSIKSSTIDPEDYGFSLAKAEAVPSFASAHPDFTTTIGFPSFLEEDGELGPVADAEDISISLPAGLTGAPSATATCDTGDFVGLGNCPRASQVGITKVRVGKPLHTSAVEPVYNLTPPHPDIEVARLGFIAFQYPVFIDVQVRTDDDYGVTATAHTTPGLGAVISAKTTLWGDPSSEVHDPERVTPAEELNSEAVKCKGTACIYAEEHEGQFPKVSRTGLAFMTNPSACQEGSVGLEATAYQLPGQTFTASAPMAPITDCTGLSFAPELTADPTSHEAGAPTGLKTKLMLPQHLKADERATATMREARVTLPEGMQVAAGAANWIGTCSDSQVGYHEEVDTACPDSSKLGTATIISPALSTPIEGTIYQRSPEPGHQLGLWLTADALGMHIKLPGSLEPDNQTGRLTAVFSDLPQVPVEEIDLDVWGGPRAPLQNPDHCGTFTTDFSFAPHSNDPAATGQSTMRIDEGCNQSFDPTLHAGVTDPVAGKFSPFVFDLTRGDGQQALRGFELKLPDGELAKLKGVPLCSDADANAGTCPQGSRIGHLQATTGPGPDPLTIPQPGKPEPQIYLAGPYKGSPFSIVSEVPAQAGPFDLGVLAVRSGLDVEPETGRAVVKADPLPQFFEGVGIAYRNLHAVVDRPEFNLNPTDCREMTVDSDVTSTQGTVAHPAARFQVDGCKALKFKPKLSLKLKGGTKRADYPALTAVLKARKGDANIAFASVALPHSEFLAQEHIGTICTRVQFAADTCPKGSVYGKAKALTPLLDKPLSGPVYLRSSDHPLPDLVAKLGGELEIDLVGRIDSAHGGIRTTFESVPDAPVSKFVLQMKGGKKGLLTNSTDICRGAHKATARMKAQNGRVATLRPALQSTGCGKKKLGKHKHHH